MKLFFERNLTVLIIVEEKARKDKFKAAVRKIHDEYIKKLDELLDMKKPNIICLCGSTRFTNEMLIKQWELTKQGNIVLSWCALPESYFKGPHIGDVEGVKDIVDEVHLRKIDLADSVLVINIGGYFGESTTKEIAYAKKTGKPVSFLEPYGNYGE